MAIRAIHRKLLRDFWHFRGQALAIAMVIAGGVATWIISFSTIDSLEQTQRAYYQESRFAQVFDNLKRAPERLADRIRAIPGVAEVEVRTMSLAMLEVPGFDQPVTGQLVSLPDTGNAKLNKLYLREGRLPRARSPDEVVIGEPFAEAQHLHPGDHLWAIINGKRERLSIVGVGLSPEFIYQIRPGDLFPDYKRYGILWMRNEAQAAAQGTRNAFNSVVLTLRKGASEQEVIDRLDRLLAPYGGIGAYGRADQASHEYLHQEVKGLKAMAGVVPVIFLGVAAFLLNVVITRLVAQQREQIAVLKAFGYSNWAVGLHYLTLVLVIVIAGALPGVALGAWLGHGLSVMYSDFFRFPFLQYVLLPQVALGGVGVAMLAAVLGTLRSVRRAVRLPPAEAMRPEPPASFRPTVVERLGAQKLFDQPSRMILRHLERQPLKALLSILGIAMAGAILMVGNFQEDAVDYMINVQFNLAQREDLTVTFTEPSDKRTLFELESLPGVEAVEGFRAVPVELIAGHRRYRTAIRGYPSNGILHRTLNTRLHPVELPRSGLLLTDYLAKKLHVKPGDVMTVRVLEGSKPVRQVPVAGTVKEYIGVSAYMDIHALNRLMREGAVFSGAFLAIDPAQRLHIFRDLRERPRVQGVSQREVAISSFEETMGETLLIFAFINTLLAASIAFGVIYNTARIAFSEHSRELASLRVLGFTRGEIAYILLGELAVLTLAAIPLGFYIGYQFCSLLVGAISSELYRVPLVIETSTYGASAVVVLVSSVISALIVRRRLYHLDLVSVLKTRE